MSKYNIPPCFYRISTKALVLDSEKKFLMSQKEDGTWDIPGGGLDYGEDPHVGLKREIEEEMGLEVESIAKNPCYFLTSQKEPTFWFANVVYIVTLKNLDFKKSNECMEIGFFTKEEALQMNVISNVKDFCDVFDKRDHD